MNRDAALEVGQLGRQGVELLPGQGAHFLIVLRIVDNRPKLFRLAARVTHVVDRLDHRHEIGIFLGQARELVARPDRRVGEALFQLAVMGEDLIQLFVETA